jgi:hypothetical protein
MLASSAWCNFLIFHLMGKSLSLAPTACGATHSSGDTPQRPGEPPATSKPGFRPSCVAANPPAFPPSLRRSCSVQRASLLPRPTIQSAQPRLSTGAPRLRPGRTGFDVPPFGRVRHLPAGHCQLPQYSGTKAAPAWLRCASLRCYHLRANLARYGAGEDAATLMLRSEQLCSRWAAERQGHPKAVPKGHPPSEPPVDSLPVPCGIWRLSLCLGQSVFTHCGQHGMHSGCSGSGWLR